jgi:hypothetical protein
LQNPDIEITEAFDFVTPVEEEYQGSMVLLYEGAFGGAGGVAVFARLAGDFCFSRSALPLSVIPAFIGMRTWAFPSTWSRCWRCRW